MSKKPNIYTIKENMDLKSMVNLINQNFQSIARSTGLNFQEMVVHSTQVHNELSGRDVSDCHNIDSISLLRNVLDELNTEKLDKETAIDTLFPAGKAIISTQTNKNPATYLGGTWTLLSSTSSEYKWKRTA